MRKAGFLLTCISLISFNMPYSYARNESNLAINRPVEIQTNGVEHTIDDDGNKITNGLFPKAITDGMLSYQDSFASSPNVVAWSIARGTTLEVKVKIFLEKKSKISKIRYNPGNVGYTLNWSVDSIDTPCGTIAPKIVSGEAVWSEGDCNLDASEILLTFKKTRTGNYDDWLSIGEVEVIGTTLNMAGWLTAKNVPCQIWISDSQPNMSVLWSGKCSANRKATGKGVLDIRIGDHKYLHYDGNLLEGKFHGSGTLTLDDGNRFSGIFQNHLKVNGTWFWKNGSRYEGEFRNEKRSGFGKIILVKDDAKLFANQESIKLGKWLGETFVGEGLWENDSLILACPSKKNCLTQKKALEEKMAKERRAEAARIAKAQREKAEQDARQKQAEEQEAARQRQALRTPGTMFCYDYKLSAKGYFYAYGTIEAVAGDKVKLKISRINTNKLSYINVYYNNQIIEQGAEIWTNPDTGDWKICQ